MKFSKAPQSPSVSALLEQAVLQNKSLTEGDARSRKELLATARSLCNALETPMEAVLRMGWGDVRSRFMVVDLTSCADAPVMIDVAPGGSSNRCRLETI